MTVCKEIGKPLHFRKGEDCERCINFIVKLEERLLELQWKCEVSTSHEHVKYLALMKEVEGVLEMAKGVE